MSTCLVCNTDLDGKQTKFCSREHNMLYASRLPETREKFYERYKRITRMVRKNVACDKCGKMGNLVRIWLVGQGYQACYEYVSHGPKSLHYIKPVNKELPEPRNCRICGAECNGKYRYYCSLSHQQIGRKAQMARRPIN